LDQALFVGHVVKVAFDGSVAEFVHLCNFVAGHVQALLPKDCTAWSPTGRKNPPQLIPPCRHRNAEGYFLERVRAALPTALNGRDFPHFRTIDLVVATT
jgi:hypothetical protein